MPSGPFCLLLPEPDGCLGHCYSPKMQHRAWHRAVVEESVTEVLLQLPLQLFTPNSTI